MDLILHEQGFELGSSCMNRDLNWDPPAFGLVLMLWQGCVCVCVCLGNGRVIEVSGI